MTEVVAWYIHGASGEEAPDSLEALRRVARRSTFTAETLLRTDKWDFLIREGVQETAEGFVPLRALATTKRGIATGANEFFHVAPSVAAQHGIPRTVLVPCVGRAADVGGFEFTAADLEVLVHQDRRAYLVTFGAALTAPERAYIARGEAEGIQERYLLAVRKPWYSMEGQEPAPIWAAVFGRRGLRFVHNRANALTLTTFHCVYPFDGSAEFAAALTLCLNLPSVQAAARAHTRVYGGGLLKFEPKDLLEIKVPDLRRVGADTLHRLDAEQSRVAAELRAGGEDGIDWVPAELAVRAAAAEAAASPLPEEPAGARRDRTTRRRPQDARTHHGDRGASHGARPRSSGSRRTSPAAGPTLWES
jgi:adenine-specific DNA-methyltransferase